MHPPIAEINYPVDWNRIPVNKIKQNLIPFFGKNNLDYLEKHFQRHVDGANVQLADTIKRSNNSMSKGYLPWWKTFRLEKPQLKGYLKQIDDDLGFGLNENMTFYWYPANVTLPMHVDIRSCSINLVLSRELAPLHFKEYGDFYYDKFVFDGLHNEHTVPIKMSERFTMQLAFYGVPYEEVLGRLEEKGLLIKSSETAHWSNDHHPIQRLKNLGKKWLIPKK